MRSANFVLMCAILTLNGCVRQPEALIGPLPETLPGGWKRVAEIVVTNDEAPGTLRSLGLREAKRGQYAGPADVEVLVYEMANPTVAFEARQKWTPVANAVSSHRGACFFAARSAAGRQTALTFLESFEGQVHCGAQ